MIENHLKKINRNQVLPAGAILTGSGSNLFSVEEIAKASLRLPAKTGILMPSSNNSLVITAPSNNLRDQILNDPGWSVALGLCVFGFNNNHYLYESEKSAKGGGKIMSMMKNWLHNLLP